MIKKSLRKINVDVSHIEMTTIHLAIMNKNKTTTTIHLAIMNKNQTTSQKTNKTPSIQVIHIQKE